ncbi:MAG TPA: uL15 family ribosomal protein [Candidatus Paceibacterota bacterium]|nr:uL15 family ribosomal protein [Candidatus Pacearchaeota archaeon]HRZ50965.1 uL15 family ribosomal protein [Candidatus Paceibacterota bacterium]HSA36686.1 uL15 family ribosomal protein [Candidatus Paceibacterota bacterium]
MQLNQIITINKPKKSKRIGRGGKRGTYSGHGGKGQTARSGRKMRPIVRDIIKKYPKLRGYKNHAVSVKPQIMNVSELEKKFQKGDTVSPKVLYEKNLTTRAGGVLSEVKILGSGELKKELHIKGCVVSKTAREKIVKAGGTVK